MTTSPSQNPGKDEEPRYPPLSDEAKIEIRAAADEYWSLWAEAKAAGREFGRRRGERRRRQSRIDFPDRRSGNDRRQG